MALLKPVGYPGSCFRTLQRYISWLREAGFHRPRLKGRITLPKVVDLQLPPFTPRQATYLMRTQTRAPAGGRHRTARTTCRTASRFDAAIR